MGIIEGLEAKCVLSQRIRDNVLETNPRKGIDGRLNDRLNGVLELV